MTASAAGTSLPSHDLLPAGLILGRDNNDRPHAAWFMPDQLEQAESAASIMGMHFVPVGENQDLAAIATKLPKGKMFDSGKAFVPFISGAVFETLLPHAPPAAAEHKEPKPKAPTPAKVSAPADDPALPPAPIPGIDLPKDWSAIKVGSVVLASESREDGWWEAKVVEAKPNDVFILRWSDYPDLEPFVRHRERLALMFPRPFAS
jgi:hypothetical protein